MFDLTQLFDSPDDLAAFCMLDNEGQAAKLRELAEQGRILKNLHCSIPEDITK